MYYDEYCNVSDGVRNVSQALAVMSGLAHELLADIEGISGGEEDDYQEDNEPKRDNTSPALKGLKRKLDDDADMSDVEEEGVGEEGTDGQVGGLVLEGGVKPAEELDAEDVQQMDLAGIEDVGSIAKLEDSKRMADILKARTS